MRQIYNLLFFLFTVAVLSGISFGMTDYRKKQVKVRAPELTGGKSWLNTDKPLSLSALKGKIVLLDFWTYGCINCIHIIPDLKKLEARYGRELVVIGVHSAKFDNEAETENIRKIILRYGVEHPVVNDADFKIWNAYAVNAYPTQILIDPAGYVIGKFVGEGHSAEVDAAIAKTAAEFRQKGALNEQPLKFALERAKVGDLPLAFPGKILADEKSNRLFISDTNHNRIVVTDLNGKLIETIGGGEYALEDGDFKSAAFKRPQGMALDGDALYVADTENHAVRRIDLKNKTVETVAGTGRQAEWRSTGGAAKTSALSSPWDLAKVGDRLFIAMAGTHQIWRLDLGQNTVAPFAGTSGEARLDGKIAESAFAQPSGIVSDGRSLFVADSESNIIRRIDLKEETVETLAGGDLYTFGDEDGEGDDVRFQHPLGIVLYSGKLLIADTYNHKIKTLDAEKRSVETVFGTGKTGQTDGARATFYEPGGLSVAAGRLFVADTNNHAVRVVDLQTKQASTLKIEGLKPPAAREDKTETVLPNRVKIKLDRQTAAANRENVLNFQIKLPAGYHLNPDAPQRYEVKVISGESVKIAELVKKFRDLPLVVPFSSGAAGAATLEARLTIYYCREDNTGECLIKTLVWEVPLKIENAQAKSEILLAADLEGKR